MKITGNQINKLLAYGREIDPSGQAPEIEKIAGLFPRGYMSIIASAPGTGKTWLTLLLSAQLSTGGTILAGLAESKPQKVILMSGETGRSILEARISQTAWPVEQKNFLIFDALEMGADGIDYMLNTAQGQENIIAITANLKPDLLIFDTLISFHTLDESKQGDMTKIFIFLNRLAKSFNCAVLCNHHTRKRPSDAPNREQNQDDVIGSSAGIRLASSIYLITSKDSEAGNSIMTVKNAKAWDKKIPPFSYSFTTREGKTDFEVNLNVNSIWSSKTRIEKIIADIDNNSILRPKELSKALNISERLTRDNLERFTEAKILNRVIFNGDIAYKKC